MALQYYYWAYSLLRTIQRPNEVKDGEGRVLVNWLPIKIEEILGNIQVAYEKREGDCVDLLFSYNHQPLSSLEFTYSDGTDGGAETNNTAVRQAWQQFKGEPAEVEPEEQQVLPVLVDE